jgi:hypothetical protein
VQQFKPSRWEVGIPVGFLEGVFPLSSECPCSPCSMILVAGMVYSGRSFGGSLLGEAASTGREGASCCVAPHQETNGKCQCHCDKCDRRWPSASLPSPHQDLSTEKKQERPANDPHDIPKTVNPENLIVFFGATISGSSPDLLPHRFRGVPRVHGESISRWTRLRAGLEGGSSFSAAHKRERGNYQGSHSGGNFPDRPRGLSRMSQRSSDTLVQRGLAFDHRLRFFLTLLAQTSNPNQPLVRASPSEF